MSALAKIHRSASDVLGGDPVEPEAGRPAARVGAMWAAAGSVGRVGRTAGDAGNCARRPSRSVPAELVDLPAPGDPALATDIHDVLDRLSPEHRAVLTLRDLEGLDEQTAGAMLGVPTGTVRSRLVRLQGANRRTRRLCLRRGGHPVVRLRID